MGPIFVSYNYVSLISEEPVRLKDDGWKDFIKGREVIKAARRDSWFATTLSQTLIYYIFYINYIVFKNNRLKFVKSIRTLIMNNFHCFIYFILFKIYFLLIIFIFNN